MPWVRLSKDWLQVMDHDNWVRKNMIPTKGKIEVIAHQLFMQQILDA